MGENSKIAWTDHTFNPWMGCTKVSAGCAHCYAEALVTGRMGKDVWGPDATRQVTSAANWRKPVQWNRRWLKRSLDTPRLRRERVFCGSLCDVFEDHPVAHEARDRLWELIRDTPHLDWLLLTKRPELIERNLPYGWDERKCWPNVWLGTSIENNDVVHRADALRQIKARVRFLSYEPALGPIDKVNLKGIDWVICGGESGPGFRPMDMAWARSIGIRCKLRNIPFFFKQVAAFRPGTGDLDGETIQEVPWS